MTDIAVRSEYSGAPDPARQGTSRMLERAKLALAEPFVGVRARGEAPASLFAVRESGVSTEAITTSARRFLAQFTPAVRDEATFALDALEWRAWSNIHRSLMRHGVPLDESPPAERERALELVASALSEDGFTTARDVMRLNGTLAEITGRPGEFGEWRYWLSVFGEPSSDAPWGFQMDGHHINLNCFVLGDQVVLTPLFLGSEPVFAESGRYAGTRVLQAEEEAGLALMGAMSPAERALAIVGAELPRELLAAAFRDNLELGYEGIPYRRLSPAARERLVALIGRYVGRIRSGHAEVKMAEVREHLDATYFAWIGGTGRDDVYYYRVHSPVILIEFDHQSGVVFDNDYPTRRHVHTVVRTPNGNDYGKDLLAQHYATHHGGSGVR